MCSRPRDEKSRVSVVGEQQEGEGGTYGGRKGKKRMLDVSEMVWDDFIHRRMGPCRAATWL